MALGCSGTACLISDPPTYRDPEQTPPMLITALADPPTTQIVTMDLVPELQITTKEFSVPVRSEDAGEPLVAALYKNYDPTQKSPDPAGKTTLIAASTFDDKVERRASGTLSVDGTDATSTGCRQVTLVVTHQNNFFTQQDSSDVAQVTWWVNLVNPLFPSDEGLSDCVKKVTTQ
jgi:hypothetical protein